MALAVQLRVIHDKREDPTGVVFPRAMTRKTIQGMLMPRSRGNPGVRSTSRTSNSGMVHLIEGDRVQDIAEMINLTVNTSKMAMGPKPPLKTLIELWSREGPSPSLRIVISVGIRWKTRGQDSPRSRGKEALSIP